MVNEMTKNIKLAICYIECAAFFIGCSIIYFGIYYLCAKAKIRNAEKKGTKPELKRLRLSFFVIWLILLILFVWFCLNYVGVLL